MITLDFETEAIVGSPLVTPPRPVGIAILSEDYPAGDYLTGDQMKRCWTDSLASDEDLLFHNAPFDLSVGKHWLGGTMPEWSRIHDTMYLLFMADPYAKSLSLKPSAERYLGDPPETQNTLHDWILCNVRGATKRNAGAYISEAPRELVAPYAIDDVLKTRNLYDFLTEAV